jgi:hypothetical protein
MVCMVRLPAPNLWPCSSDVACLHQVSLPAQLVLINMSLAINDALMHIPNFYVFWNLGSIICGAIFYHVRLAVPCCVADAVPEGLCKLMTTVFACVPTDDVALCVYVAGAGAAEHGEPYHFFSWGVRSHFCRDFDQHLRRAQAESG